MKYKIKNMFIKFRNNMHLFSLFTIYFFLYYLILFLFYFCFIILDFFISFYFILLSSFTFTFILIFKNEKNEMEDLSKIKGKINVLASIFFFRQVVPFLKNTTFFLGDGKGTQLQKQKQYFDPHFLLILYTTDVALNF